MTREFSFGLHRVFWHPWVYSFSQKRVVSAGQVLEHGFELRPITVVT